MSRSVGLFVGVVLCLLTATSAAPMQAPPDPRVAQVMNACQSEIAEFRVRNPVTSVGQEYFEAIAAWSLQHPEQIPQNLAVYIDHYFDLMSWPEPGRNASRCVLRFIQRLSRSPSPSPSPAPRPPVSPAVTPRVSPPAANPSVESGRILQRYQSVLDDVLADLERAPAATRKVPLPPKVASATPAENQPGEDATACLKVYWPISLFEAPTLQNTCAYQVEAMWCVEPCGRLGNTATIDPTRGNDVGYPIDGIERAAGRYSEISFSGCKGKNTISKGSVPGTHTCGPPQ